MTEQQLQAALKKFEELVREQSARSDRIKAESEFVDFDKLDKIIIGVCGGDGIGPIITKESARVLEYMLDDEVKAGKVEFKVIDGLTIENRIAKMKAIPDDVLEELKKCHVILKGPTTTPQAGGDMPNIESANVAMRKALDLFANVRPVKIPEQGIDWTFFRENTEGAYAVGSKGVNVDDDLAFDFVVTTSEGTERIARLAYEYARKNHKDRVSIINKANVIKTTDGKFLNICKKVGEEYPEITTDEWYIDITTAKLIDEKRRKDFKVFVLPNLYGDIITDEAAEFQGGVGTAGSANLGKKYAMFEVSEERPSQERLDEIAQNIARKEGISLEDTTYLMSLTEIGKDMYNPEDDSIGILYKDGTVKDISEASEILNVQLLSKKIRKYYLCYQRF